LKWTVARGEPVRDVEFSNDGNFVLVSCPGGPGATGIWRISRDWPPYVGRGPTWLLPAYGHHNGEVPAIAFSPDGRRVAAGFASDGYTAVWEVPEGKGP
jgi:WD40 repeat protein